MVLLPSVCLHFAMDRNVWDRMVLTGAIARFAEGQIDIDPKRPAIGCSDCATQWSVQCYFGWFLAKSPYQIGPGTPWGL